jgi:hypothetical protein
MASSEKLTEQVAVKTEHELCSEVLRLDDASDATFMGPNNVVVAERDLLESCPPVRYMALGILAMQKQVPLPPDLDLKIEKARSFVDSRRIIEGEVVVTPVNYHA